MKTLKRCSVALAVLLVLLIMLPSAAFAGYLTPDEGPDVGSGDTNQPGEVLGRTVTRGGESLPITGSDVAAIALIGAGAAVTGVVLVRRGRKTAA